MYRVTLTVEQIDPDGVTVGPDVLRLELVGDSPRRIVRRVAAAHDELAAGSTE